MCTNNYTTSGVIQELHHHQHSPGSLPVHPVTFLDLRLLLPCPIYLGHRVNVAGCCTTPQNVALSPGSRIGRKRQRGGAKRKRRRTRAWSLLFCGLYVSLRSHRHNDHFLFFIALLLLQWRHVRASAVAFSLAGLLLCVQGQAVQLRCSCPAI